LAPVQKNLAITAAALIKQRHYRRGLHDPVQPGTENGHGTARKTVASGIVPPEIREMFLEKRLGGGQEDALVLRVLYNLNYS
jgi:hypothetical protein